MLRALVLQSYNADVTCFFREKEKMLAEQQIRSARYWSKNILRHWQFLSQEEQFITIYALRSGALKSLGPPDDV